MSIIRTNLIIQFIRLDKNTVSNGPHDKVFPAISTHSNNQSMTGFPAPDGLLISDETSLLLPPSSTPQPFLHLGLTGVHF